MSKILKIGIAGYGVVGIRRHEFINKYKNAKVVGICDFKFSVDPQVMNDIKIFSDYKKLLEMELDAVFVCLPNDIAPQVSIAALQKNMHVFCEKPPGRTVKDIQDVIAVEQKSPHLKLKYGFNHRYHGSVVKALSIIESGELGEVLNMRGVYGKSAIIPWPRPQPEYLKESGKYWRTDREVAGGGILLDQGIHMVDLMRAFGGNFTQYKSIVSNNYWKHDVEDNVFALMANEKGVVGMLHSTATQWQHRFSLEVHLSQGALVLSGILTGSRSYGEEKLTIIKRIDEDNGNPQELILSYNHDDSWSREIDEFLDCITNNTSIRVGSSDEALKTMQTVFNIYNADESWSNYIRAEAKATL